MTYGIDYELMRRLNYHDLLALVIEYDIENIREHIKQLQKQKDSKLGRNVKVATNDDILRMHKKRM